MKNIHSCSDLTKRECGWLEIELLYNDLRKIPLELLVGQSLAPVARPISVAESPSVT